MMKKVKTKAVFETQAHRVISRRSGEIIRMPDEDYEEVKDLVEIIEEPAAGLGVSVNETILTVDHGPGKKKK
jgi:hypothetical protein